MSEVVRILYKSKEKGVQKLCKLLLLPSLSVQNWDSFILAVVKKVHRYM